MIGSTFIHAVDGSSLAVLAEDLDRLDEFDRVELDSMITLDFEEICSATGVEWAVGEPLIFDEEGGLAVFHVSPRALQQVLCAVEDSPAEHRTDLEALRSLLARVGVYNIYELTTF